jgi:phosphoribosylformimino-5-aminoimidazole carboxamide ribotide isomerase
LLGQWSGCPMVYAGGIATMYDIEEIEQQSGGHMDYTVGSALDLFGGRTIRYAELIHRH